MVLAAVAVARRRSAFFQHNREQVERMGRHASALVTKAPLTDFLVEGIHVRTLEFFFYFVRMLPDIKHVPHYD